MKKLLQFPKEKSKRAWALKKAEGQRLFLSMSLFSLILVAVFANEQMVRTERPIYLVSGNTQGPDRLDALNRAIASAQPVNVFRDLEWEHQLAKKLGREIEDGRQPASISQKITLMDDLRYGPLAGKYRIIASEQAGVAEIEYVDSSEITDKPVQIGDAASFLSKYRSLMGGGFETAALSYQGQGREEYQLLGADQNPVGRASVEFDGEGNLLKLSIQK